MMRSTRILPILLASTGATAWASDDSAVLADKETRLALASRPATELVLEGQPRWRRLAPAEVLPNTTFGIAVAIDPRRPDRIVAGFRPQGVYRSLDSGKTWELLPGNPKTNGDFGVNSESLVFDPHHPDRVFIGYENAGVYWTTDFGESVISANKGLENKNVIAGAFDPDNPLRIFIGTDDGMHVSEDGGKSWKTTHIEGSGLPRREKKEDHPTCLSLAFDPFDSSTVYASFLDANPADDAGVYISRDGGRTWQASNRGLDTGYRKPQPDFPFKMHAETGSSIQPSPLEAGVVYFATGSQGLWKSIDRGKHWRNISDPEMGERAVPALALHPSMPGVIAIGDGLGIVYISRDDGETWTPFSNGLRVGREAGSKKIGIAFTSNDGEKLQLSGLSREFVNKIEALCFSPDGKRLFAATGAGLYAAPFSQ